MIVQRICYACDLKDHPELIEEYKNHHKKGMVWPEITKSIKDSGIEDMEIYLIGNRMFMIMEVNETYSAERKAIMDASDEKVQEWEDLMMNYQQFLPFEGVDQKWVEMERIFKLD